MDAVRFGRALGAGARQAVKTTMAAVDAATAENPSGKRAGTGVSAGGVDAGQAPPSPRQALGAADTSQAAVQMGTQAATRKAAHRAAQTVVQARGAKQGLGRGSRRFGEAVWKPFVRLSGVLWMEVTGVFFGVFALFAFGGVWHLRGQWHSSAVGHRQLVGALVMMAVFSYFCVSNFVRARRRERRR